MNDEAPSFIDAGVLRVAYEEHRTALMARRSHAAARLSLRRACLRRGERDARRRGCRVIVPYLRGYGPTRFRSDDTMRSGQQAALAHDLLVADGRA
jgi:hypothetical protein